MPATAPFQFVDSWQRMTPADAQAVQDFWLRENAHVAGNEAARRAHEVAVRILASDGRLVGITTAEPRLIPRLMQPMYYLRGFVGAEWRNGKILRMRMLLQKTVEALETWSRERDFPCIGVVLELENTGFGKTLQRAYWSNGHENGYSYIGRSARGLDMRVRYFIGARLKTPAEIAAIVHASTAASAPGAAASTATA